METSACVVQRRPSDALDISPGNSGEILLILEGSRGRSVARKEPGAEYGIAIALPSRQARFFGSSLGGNRLPNQIVCLTLSSVLALLQFLPVM